MFFSWKLCKDENFDSCLGDRACYYSKGTCKLGSLAIVKKEVICFSLSFSFIAFEQF